MGDNDTTWYYDAIQRESGGYKTVSQKFMYRNVGIYWNQYSKQPAISYSGVFENRKIAYIRGMSMGKIMISQWIYACAIFKQTHMTKLIILAMYSHNDDQSSLFGYSNPKNSNRWPSLG